MRTPFAPNNKKYFAALCQRRASIRSSGQRAAVCCTIVIVQHHAVPSSISAALAVLCACSQPSLSRLPRPAWFDAGCGDNDCYGGFCCQGHSSPGNGVNTGAVSCGVDTISARAPQRRSVSGFIRACATFGIYVGIFLSGAGERIPTGFYGISSDSISSIRYFMRLCAASIVGIVCKACGEAVFRYDAGKSSCATFVDAPCAAISV